MTGPIQFLMTSIFICVLALAGAVVAADDIDKDDGIPLDKVPKPVLAAVKKRFPDAKLEGAAKQIEDAETFYEILITHKTREIYVICKPDGKIVEIDRQMTVKELPKAVAESLKKNYPKADIATIEEITEVTGTKEGDVISYAVRLRQNKKALHVVFDPKGKVLDEAPDKEKE
jgi:hypothetical protein